MNLLSLSLIASFVVSVSSFPSFPQFKQNVFSTNHEVLLDYPELFKEYHSSADSVISESWKELLGLPAEELRAYFKDAIAPEVERATGTGKFLSFGDMQNYQIVADPKYEDYQFRIKQNSEKLGLDTVEQYVGYLDIRDTDKHLFYWFFESRNDPKNDPVILWLNGGPGCSSTGSGMLFELGPSFIDSELKPVYNPYAWNANASVIYLDQPVGVGFSYADEKEDENVDTSDKAAKDVYIFLELFFQKFPDLLKNKFHIAGESYAGHYIPRIAAEIVDHPERSFDIASLLIGNGAVDQFFQKHYDQKMLCGEGGLDVISQDNCTQMGKYLDKCLLFQELCSIKNNLLTCVPLSYYCNLTYGPLNDLNLNRYDLRRPCEDNRLCYGGLNYVSDFMNLESVRSTIGVPPFLVFESCKSDVGNKFRKQHDSRPFEKYIGKVLDYGIPVLHYAGDKDFVCHWLGYNAVSNRIAHKNQEQFNKAEFKPWIVDGKEFGQVRGYEGFTFLRFYNAGHMVPHDQPEIALTMLLTWLAGDFSFGS